MKKGLLLVVSGPAGSGKGTVNRLLLESPDYAFSVSVTTRDPRPGEQDGVHYHYISREAFESHIRNDELLEYTEYCGNYYGTLKRETEEILESGRNLILEIEVQGAMNVKAIRPDAVAIMLLPPSYSKLEERLRGRGTETEEVILKRLAQARVELTHLPQYDYVVYNQDNGAEACAEEIRAIVEAESHAVRRAPDAVSSFFEN